MAAKTKYVIVLGINKEHHIQIKNTYSSCMYSTCTLYYFIKLNLKTFSAFYFLENEVYTLFGGMEYSRKYSIFTCYKLAHINFQLALDHSAVDLPVSLQQGN
jgi:hypothetical protein